MPGFAVVSRTVVGNFSYTKLPMVTDLQVHAEALAAHDLVAAIAGDAAAQRAVRDRQSPVEPLTLDTVPAAAEFLVLDADASQQSVIETVVRGSDSVVQGPPGTGKSQTISNLIASATAQGCASCSCEKRAAVDAVVGRLDRAGLADLVLDLHGGVSSRRRLAENLAAALGAARATADPESATVEGFLERGGRSWRRMRGINSGATVGRRLYAAQARSMAARRLALDVRLSLRPWTDRRGPAGRAQGGAEGLPRAQGGGPRRWHPPVGRGPEGGRGAVELLSDAATDLARDRLPRLRGLSKDAAVEAGLPAPGTAAAGYEQALVLDERARPRRRSVRRPSTTRRACRPSWSRPAGVGSLGRGAGDVRFIPAALAEARR